MSVFLAYSAMSLVSRQGSVTKLIQNGIHYNVLKTIKCITEKKVSLKIYAEK